MDFRQSDHVPPQFVRDRLFGRDLPGRSYNLNFHWRGIPACGVCLTNAPYPCNTRRMSGVTCSAAQTAARRFWRGAHSQEELHVLAERFPRASEEPALKDHFRSLRP
jgi:hypothetical protein